MAQNNFNSDLAIRHLLSDRITRVYRDIETNEVRTQQSITEVRGEAQNLADTIQQLADTTEENIGELEYQMQTNVQATTQLGTDLLDMMGVDYHDLEDLSPETVGLYRQRFDAAIQATARSIVESYNYAELVMVAAQAGFGDQVTLEEYLTVRDGQIARGYIEYPVGSGDIYFGIAISDHISFTGTKRDDLSDTGYTYYQIDTGQTFGLYTGEGWMFWLDGIRRGRFNSIDGFLYVDEIVVSKIHFSEHDLIESEIAGVGKVFDILYTGA